jgi:predicted RNase H-like HicB family nuclease
MLTQVEINLKLPVKLLKRKKWYVASCPILDVASQGNTQEEAKKNLIEALIAFALTAYEMGTLWDILKECGIKPNFRNKKTFDNKKEYETVDIPLPFIIDQSKNSNAAHNAY